MEAWSYLRRQRRVRLLHEVPDKLLVAGALASPEVLRLLHLQLVGRPLHLSHDQLPLVYELVPSESHRGY